MSAEWRPVTLGDLIEVRHGWPFKSEFFNTDSSDANLPIVVAIGNFEYSGGFRFHSTQVKYYTSIFPPEYKLEPGDILIVMTCQTSGGEILGIPARVPCDANTYLHNQRLGRVVLKSEEVSLQFLYWLFLHPNFNRHLVGSATGTKILHTAPSRIESFQFTLPPLWEQERIAAVLSALDDRITLLRETNSTLEAIAQALFKSWFVDFDPVHAKQQGRAPEGMDAQTAALFPDSFEESELGMVPKGWRYSTVGKSFVLTMGQSPPGDTYNSSGEGLAFYQGRTDFGFRFPERRIYCSAPTRYAEAGDSLVSVRAPVGDVNMALERCSIGRGVASVRHPHGYRGYVFYTMRALGEKFKTFDSEGTVFGSINKKDFQNIPVMDISEELLRAFDLVTKHLDEQVKNGELMLRSLSSLRDSLLPRLISGQLRLPEAQALAEEAAVHA